MGYQIRTTVDLPVVEAIPVVKAALKEQGFGVLTEIDMAATLLEKIGEEIPAQVILGACNPPLAHRSLQAEESVGLLLPCNVVVRAGEAGSIVEALDPQTMVALTGNHTLAEVAAEAATRLRAALDSLSDTPRGIVEGTTGPRADTEL